MPVSKFALFNAFLNGHTFMMFQVINRIEREDGSNHCYNVTGVNCYGETETVFFRAN